MIAAAALLLSGLIATQTAAMAEFPAVPYKVMVERLHRWPSAREQCPSTLKELFRQAGCAPQEIAEQSVPRSRSVNVICSVPGQTDETVVVGTRFEALNSDNGEWTGAALLASLAQAARHQPRRHTFRFVAFAGRDLGESGARTFLESQTPKPRVYISLLRMGFGAPALNITGSSRREAGVLQALAKAGGVRLSVVARPARRDTLPYAAFGVPVVIFGSKSSIEISLGTPDPPLAEVDLAQYFDSYRLLCAYLAALEREP